jgi:hypothetical protein
MQLKNAQQTGVVNQMAIDKGQRALDTENARKALYAGGATPTINQLYAVDPEAGVKAQELEAKKALDSSTMSKNDAATAKLQQESRNYKITQYGNALRSLDALPESERNAVYLNMIPHLAENLGPEVAASFPPAYDSKRIAALLGRSKEILDADQQVFDNEIKNRQTAASEISAAAARDRAANGGAAGKTNIQKINEVPFTVNPDGTFEAVLDPRTGKGFERVPTATEQKAKFANENKQRGLLEAISNLDVLLGTEATDTTPAVPGVLDVATSSGVGAAVDAAAQIFGKDTKGRIATGEAEVLADAILKIIPRFEGPQSDKDTLSYRQSAGQLSNPNVGRETKIAAAKTLRELFKKRAGQFTTQEEMDAGGSTPPDGAGPAGQNKNNPNDPLGLFE